MQNLLDILTRIGPARLIAIGVTVAGLLGFFGFFVTKMTTPEMSVLFTDLEPSDAGAVINRLEAMGVTVGTGPDGATVLAPRDEVARLRMLLAQDGLPAGGGGGYELLDKADGLGATSFAQQMNKLRALEGELARSIRTLSSVRQARVHLVLPKRELFSREQLEPSASIVVAVRGSALNSQQVSAIRHLVASAVPKLSPTRISIVDTNGNLLASGESTDPAGAPAGAVAQDRKIDVEKRMAAAIQELLERVVGAGNVRAEVSADLDFDRITTNSEQFDPEGQVLRSSQTVTEENEANDGASNDRVSVDRNLPNTDAEAGGAGAKSASRSQRTEEISNFEISKTIRTHIRESGLVRRLSVAVIVNAAASQNGDGQTVFTPRPAEQLSKLEALAKSAVGYDAGRGDTFEIVSMEFARPEAIFGAEDPDAIELTKEDYFRMGQLGALFLIALLAVLLVMRPAMNRALGVRKRGDGSSGAEDNGPAALAGPGGAQAQLAGPNSDALAIAGDSEGAAAGPAILSQLERLKLDRIQAGIESETLAKIGALVDEYPQGSAEVISSWIRGE